MSLISEWCNMPYRHIGRLNLVKFQFSIDLIKCQWNPRFSF